MSASDRRPPGSRFYACPACGHNDPNYFNFANALMLGGFRDRCFKCGRDLTINVNVWALHLFILFMLGLGLIVLLNAAVALDHGALALGAAVGFVGLTCFQFYLPHLLHRLFGLRMYNPPAP
jgi:hypothetical protein